MKILCTGGSGFIGSYLTDLLNREGFEIFIIDNLFEQIHGKDKYNSYLFKSIIEKANFFKENIVHSKSLKSLIGQVDFIIHLAAETGTGQSMYEVFNYVRTNSLGTANILEHLIKNKNNVKKFILASSRTVYGEGKYMCPEHGIVYPDYRDINDLERGEFECKCLFCNKDLEPLATDEESKISPKSIYGISKYNQEQLVKSICENIHIPYSIFRFQNVYGKGQSIKNPYTGIMSVFSNLLLENKRIEVFEDGLESRDFVHASDVAAAIYLDLSSDHKNQIYNVGSGKRTRIIDIIKMFENIAPNPPLYEVSGSFRIGDIRHNFADITKISTLLGFQPKISLNDGLSEIIDWIGNLHKDSIVRKYESSIREMKKLNLFIEKKIIEK